MQSTSNCPRCFAPLRAHESPGGLCPKCLLSVAMGESPVIRTAAGLPAPPPPTLDQLAPHFPQLVLQELIGRGGMGAVYRAVQAGLDRPVALKILTVDHENDPAFAERFVREARAMASLAHPNIASVYDSGRAGPWFYLLLELVDGPNLRQVLRDGDLRPAEALAIVTQICSGLEYAHGEGVVHRDIKPENVLLDRKGRVKIVDFGLAKLLHHDPLDQTLTRTDQAMGTLHYMAPEQVRRPLEVDHRADIYSLGVVFYELLTGDLPMGRFEAPSKRAHTDVRLDDVVFRTLEQDPARRYQDVRTVREDVEHISRTAAREASSLEEVEHLAGAFADELSGEEDTGVVFAAEIGGKKGVGALVGCLIALGLVFVCGLALAFLLALPVNMSHEEGSPVEQASPVPDVSSPRAATGPGASERTGVDDLLEFLPRNVRRDAVLRRLAESTWSTYRSLEFAASRAHGLAGEPGRYQVEVAAFPAELDELIRSFHFRATRAWSVRDTLDLEEALAIEQPFPSGRNARVIAVERSGDERRIMTSDGFGGWFADGARLPAEVAVVDDLVPDRAAEESLAASAEALPFGLAEVGLGDPLLPRSAVLELAAVTREYLDLEARHTSSGLGFRAGYPELVYEIDGFPAERAALAQRIFALGLPVSMTALLPFGDQPTSVAVRWEPDGAHLHVATVLAEKPAIDLFVRFGGERAVEALASLPFAPPGYPSAADVATREGRYALAAFQLYAAAEVALTDVESLDEEAGYRFDVRDLGSVVQGIERMLAGASGHGADLSPDLAAALTFTRPITLTVREVAGELQVSSEPEFAPHPSATEPAAQILRRGAERLWDLSRTSDH